MKEIKNIPQLPLHYYKLTELGAQDLKGAREAIPMKNPSEKGREAGKTPRKSIGFYKILSWL